MSYNTVIDYSIGLSGMMKNIKSDCHVEFWYVDRRARILKFDITTLPEKQAFFRKKTLIITAFDILKDKQLLDNSECEARIFFEKYYKYGHFFSQKNHAIKYMNMRVLTGKGPIIKRARDYIDKHPECLI